jgi:hypothetical protein
MAGVLGQTNATLLEVIQAAPLSDSFVSDSFGSGSGSGDEQVSKWTGKAGIWFAPVQETLESSTDGRDEVANQVVHVPVVCSIGIGDQLLILRAGNEKLLKVSGLTHIGLGLELGAGQYFRIQIEVF